MGSFTRMHPFAGVSCALLAVTVSLSESTGAGELILSNGDILKGELVRMEGAKLYWQSDSFGELAIDKSRVQQLQTSTPLKVNGHSDPCLIDALVAGELRYQCGAEAAVATPLLSLRNVEPYVSYAGGGYEYQGRVKVAGTYATGNSEEQDWDAASRTSFRRGEYRHVVTLDYDSEAVADGPTDEEYGAKYRLDWFFKERWFWYNDTAYAVDDSLNLRESYLLGSGLGVELWKSYKGFLNLEGGMTFSKERYGPPLEPDDDYASTTEKMSLRYATDFQYPLPGEAQLVHRNELLYSLEDSQDWSFAADTGINMPLGAGLFSEFLVEYDYDNLLRGAESRDDVKFSLGVGYDW